MDPQFSIFEGLMDVIIRTTAGKRYQLVTLPKPSITLDDNSLLLSHEQLQALLSSATPHSPKTWLDVWRVLKPTNGKTCTDDKEVLQAIPELARQQRLRIKLHDHNGVVRRFGNKGASGGSASKQKQSPPEKAMLGPEIQAKPAAPLAQAPTAPKFGEASAAKGSGPPANAQQKVSECKTEGEPISMISGEELLQLNDALLPGPMPFTWRRTYRSSHTRDLGLGCGWTHSGCEYLRIEDAKVLYFDDEGRQIPFALPQIHQRSKYLPEGLTLDRTSENGFILKQEGQWLKVFTRHSQRSGQLLLTQLRHPSYQPARNVLGITTPATGFAINLRYNDQNQLVKIAGNWGKEFRLLRDSQGRISAVDLINTRAKQNRRVAEYEYDANGDMVAQRNAKGVGERYAYTHHLIARRTLKTGFSFYFEWDGTDPTARCTRNWGDRGIYDYRFEWDPDNQRSIGTDSRGFSRQYQYNEYGQIVTEIDSLGGLHQNVYDHGRKLKSVDPEGHATEYFYDKDNNPAGIRDALGHRIALGYFNGRLTTVTDKDKSLWRREYNNKGQLVAVTDPYQQTTRYQYNAHGLLTQAIDPQGRQTRYQWNADGELHSVTDAEGHKRLLRYDAWGQLTESEISLSGGISAGTASFEYSPTGQVEKVTAANGDVSTYTYNDNDQLVHYSDPRGRTTQFKYDGLSQVVERIDAEGQHLRYQYDSERNLTAIINQNNEAYRFFYDGNERLIKEVGFDGRVQEYEYNQAGHLVKHIDAGEVVTQFERDALGQMLTKSSRSLVDPAIPPENTRFAYDSKGRVKETYNAHQFVTFEYNASGNLVKEHHSDLNDKRQRVQSSMADIRYNNIWPGIRSGITLPSGEHIGYQFDQQQRLTDVTLNGHTLAHIERDLLGREIGREQGDILTQTEYDPSGRLLKQHSFNQQQKQQGPIHREYGYDAFGNLSRFSDGPEQTTYVYDLLNRLKRAEGSCHETFTFDPAGNLLQQGGDRTPGIAKGNRLYMQGDRKFAYDARGNLIEEKRGKDGKLQTQFAYNLQNQLIKVVKNGQTTHYKYDPLGRRIAKEDAFGTTRFLWAGDQMVQEKMAGQPFCTTHVARRAGSWEAPSETRNNISKTYVYEPESFKPVAMVQDNEVYHYHLDHLGTPRELTNNAGKVVWKARYQTYGNLARKDIEEVENNLRFQGQYFDEETGLHYNRHRYYNPGTGQFVNQDPIGLLGGVNNYQYAPNPTGWVDPLGLSCKEGYAVVRQFENGRQEGHFTIDVVQGDLSYATHQVIKDKEWAETTIVRAGSYNLAKVAVHEAIIPLPNAQAAVEYQRSLINDPLGPYNALNNSCLSHVIDILSAGGGPTYGKSRLGYGKFYRKHGFGRLQSDKSLLD